MESELKRLREEVAIIQESFEKKVEELASVHASLKRASLVLKDFEKKYDNKLLHELRDMDAEGVEEVPSPEAGNVEGELDFSLFDNPEWVASLGMGTSEAS